MTTQFRRPSHIHNTQYKNLSVLSVLCVEFVVSDVPKPYWHVCMSDSFTGWVKKFRIRCRVGTKFVLSCGDFQGVGMIGGYLFGW